MYAGLTLAYDSFSWNYPKSLNDKFKTDFPSGVGLAGQVGVRYYFSDSIRINLEFDGGGIAAAENLLLKDNLVLKKFEFI